MGWLKIWAFFFFHNLLWVLPLSSKQHFDQVGFWFMQVWSSLHVKANWNVLSFFSHLCHCFLFFFYFSWCGLLLLLFFNLLLLVLCFKNSTVHICLKRIEDAHFFLHLVTYACNTLMYLKKNWKGKILTFRCLLFHLPILGTWKNALFSSIKYQNVRVLWRIGFLYLLLCSNAIYLFLCTFLVWVFGCVIIVRF